MLETNSSDARICRAVSRACEGNRSAAAATMLHEDDQRRSRRDRHHRFVGEARQRKRRSEAAVGRRRAVQEPDERAQPDGHEQAGQEISAEMVPEHKLHRWLEDDEQRRGRQCQHRRVDGEQQA